MFNPPRKLTLPFRFRPRLEILEARTLLSVCTVDRLTDIGQGYGPMGDLRYCLTQSQDGDRITFQVTGTINLTSALPDLTRSISIDGPGADQLTVRRATGIYRLFTIPTDTKVTIGGLTITNGNHDDGGAISNAGTLSVNNSIVSGSFAGGSGGGGIYNVGTLTLSNSTISGNSVREICVSCSGANGAGIYNSGMLTVSNSTISGNSARAYCDMFGCYGGSGGGIDNNYSGILTVINSTLSDNTADGGGAGIKNDSGMVTVADSTFSDNHGGGVDNYGTLTLSESTFSHNYAANGAAIYNASTLTVSECTFSGNRVINRGGGIYNAGTLHARNTIIAGNQARFGNDLFGDLGSLGHNLIGNTAQASGFQDTDLLYVDPRLGPLQDNGGPTQTMAILPGSPAVDAGDNAGAPVWDQRGEGFDRIVGGTIDIGAFEAQIGSATSFRVDAPQSVPAAVPFDVTVTALDAYNHVANGYAGTVRITTSDPGEGVFLPPDYTFTPEDGGSHTIPNGVILVTPGDQSVTATDTQDDSITGSVTVTVTNTGARRMAHGNRWNPIVDQVKLAFRNGEEPNWIGFVFDSPIEGKLARDRGDFLFLDYRLDFLELAIY